MWLRTDKDGVPVDPYDQLKTYAEQMLGDSAEEVLDAERFEIAEGGAAASAYTRLQFEDISQAERDNIKQALLRYCELDTLAMVMIVGMR
ncbi:hypothetical protein NB640_03680 [Oxalobacter vibrioformis]|uniref:Uncharacterized protein n=1 Tax=Oxalobacter vibrioformis TaxID=933080 RepID=A0A9E9M025_9BURK|nr:hypothetical protein [Oxalobacter vibrioformis]WAW10765.1 hypothetical protein NB640_03680 [Oxalobacter vibrioformis]